jgi:hypothetical protein
MAATVVRTAPAGDNDHGKEGAVMRTNIWIAGAAAVAFAACAASPGAAAEKNSAAPAAHSLGAAPAGAAPTPAAKPAAAAAKPAPAANPSEGIPASVVDDRTVETIIGRQINSPKGEDMGPIVNMFVDGQGRVRAALIDFGGFLGVGNRQIAVDWRALHFAADGKDNKITVALTRDQIRLAPAYKEGQPLVVLGAPPPPPAATAKPATPAAEAAPAPSQPATPPATPEK